jgi:methylated-DNA-protein-cysteine methyltransferase-like protein
MSEFAEQVYRVVRAIPRGKVLSYGGVAAILGKPRAARGVGSALFALEDGNDVPWWRVVNHNGEISIKGVPHGPAIQRALLEREGVRFDRHGRIDWKRFGWSADGAIRPDEESSARDDNARAHKPRHTTRSVALAISRPGRPRKLIIVRRPPDDLDLPDGWGLPAASLRPGETSDAAALRAARDKLGVVVELGPEINRGSTLRGRTRLEMRLFRATLRAGKPHVPQPVRGVTQYTAWRWDTTDALRPAADRGSLCCRLVLAAPAGRDRSPRPTHTARKSTTGRRSS